MNNCRYRDITRMNVGAIVMNCNPFTLGHRHLIEFASKQVDFLYVFCVEEDLSAVPFEDRIYLMKQGTRDLKNVVVIPSGRFVLSRYTMPSYFRKEEQKLVVKDASCDVEIFGYYIAPKLNIKTRFVGEEPTDIVTREYNEKMRSILPELGIRFVEIPRRENEYGEIISASVVRKLVETNDYDKIKSFVPQTTFDYLRGKPVWNKINKAMVNDQKDEENKYKYKWVFDEYNGVILFGIGNKGIEYFQSLSVVDQNKVVFVDRCAHNAETFLDGREVFGPDKLQTEIGRAHV